MKLSASARHTEPPQRTALLMQPSVRILAGLVAGLIAGALLASSSSRPALLAIAEPVGKLWLDGLTMTVVPLVTALLITGVFDAGQSGGNAIARRAFAWFAGLLIVMSLVGALLALALLDLWPIPAQATRLIANAGLAPPIPAGNWLANIIPVNVFAAAADSAMVPLVVFSLLFGFALIRVDPGLGEPVARLFRGVAQTMLVIIGWVLALAPIGVLALAFVVGTKLGSGAAGVLLHYVVIIIAVCLATTLLVHVLAGAAGGAGMVGFARAALPSQAIAFSTQSSLASLPAMVAAAHPLGVAPARAGIILPLAVSMFRAASAAANVAVAVYLAHLHGVAITANTLVVGALVGAAVSIGAIGLPAQVTFFAIVGPICIAMGVPTVLLPLLLAIETLPDIFRTIGNVTADLAVMRLAGRSDAGAAGE